MFRRRGRSAAGEPAADGAPVEHAPDAPDAPTDAADQPDADGAGPDGGDQAEPGTAQSPRADGPWDAAEVDVDELRSGSGVLDLGGLLLRPGGPDVQVQVQVLDQASGTVANVVLVWRDSAVQVVAVAAPRSRSHWPDMRAAVRADAERQGARVSEATGPYGAELHILLPLTTPDGRSVMQPSRVIGVDGPRWLVRADFMGRAALEPAPFQRLLAALRGTVVLRGGEPMAPGDRIPLRMPSQPDPTEHGDATEADSAAPTLDELDPGPTITEIR